MHPNLPPGNTTFYFTHVNAEFLFMWIAKPVRELNPVEQTTWNSILGAIQARGDEAPLAQTLAWSRAIEAVSGRAFAVFNPNEQVGGLVFATASPTRGALFECINGPLLAWDEPGSLPRQLATFATAVSRLHPRFESLTLRPRWLGGDTERRLPFLPVPPASNARAATLKIELTPGIEAAEQNLSPRLKRTLAASDKAGATATWEELTASDVADFAPKMQYFGRARGFVVPPVNWFLALTQHPDLATERLRFARVRASAEGAESELLIAVHGTEAHYLFGHEAREPGTRGAVSPSAIAHRLALRQVALLGALSYDLNGYLEEPNQQNGALSPNSPDPYTQVARFKAQFGARVVNYEVPEFRIGQ